MFKKLIEIKKVKKLRNRFVELRDEQLALFAMCYEYHEQELANGNDAEARKWEDRLNATQSEIELNTSAISYWNECIEGLKRKK